MQHNSNGEPGKIGGSDGQGTPADRLSRAVSLAVAGDGSRDELEEAARSLVAELRGQAHAPEQMLVEIKRLLADAGLRATYSAADTSEWRGNRAAIYRDIITWSIRFYYEDGKPA